MAPGKQLKIAFALTAGAALFGAYEYGARRHVRVELPPDSMVRAVAAQDPFLFEAAVAEQIDVNERDAEGRTPLLLAAEKGDEALIQRLLDLGASVDLADAAGLTPVMIAAGRGEVEMLKAFITRSSKLDAADAAGRSALHYALEARRPAAVDCLLPLIAELGESYADLLRMACATDDAKILSAILERAPAEMDWTESTRRALTAALSSGEKELVRLLVSKHSAAPTAEGNAVPLIAQAIVKDDLATCRGLLEAGADPNLVLSLTGEKSFVAALPNFVRSYVKGDDGVTLLMLAAGLGKADFVRALLAAGADRNRQTAKYKMLALYFAARTEKWECMQMLLGRGPTPDELRIEISLRSQRAAVFKDGLPIFETQCSTGREGFATRSGKFVITDKKRDHISSIYKVAMPYFMRLNCLDFGMHEGVVRPYPASHGCIRLPSEAARKLFSEIPVGTVVMIN